MKVFGSAVALEVGNANDATASQWVNTSLLLVFDKELLPRGVLVLAANGIANLLVLGLLNRRLVVLCALTHPLLHKIDGLIETI